MQDEGEKTRERGAELSCEPSRPWPWCLRSAWLSKEEWTLACCNLWGAPLEPGLEEKASSCCSVEMAVNIYESWALLAHGWQGFQKRIVHLPSTLQAAYKHCLLGKRADFYFISFLPPFDPTEFQRSHRLPPELVGQREVGGLPLCDTFFHFMKKGLHLVCREAFVALWK